jgi:hypothetical protein
MEWGGDLDSFLNEQPFDTSAMRSASECVDYTLGGWGSARVGAEAAIAEFAPAYTLANAIEELPPLTDAADTPGSKEVECIVEDCRALGHLAGYYMNKIMAAEALGIFRKTMDAGQLTLAEQLTETAIGEWEKLAAVTAEHYVPFPARLRMGKQPFTWASQLPNMERDRQIIQKAKEQFEAWLPKEGERPKLTGVPVRRVTIAASTPEEALAKSPFARVTVAAVGDVTVRALYRQPGRDWTAVPLVLSEPHVYALPPDAKIRLETGALDYYFEATVGERKAVWPEDEEGNPASIACVVQDHTPALSIADLKWELNGAKDKVQVEFRVSAEAGVQSAHIKYKPLPSTAQWSTTDGTVRSDGTVRGEFPVSALGAVFYVYAYDNASGGVSYPDFMYETPYVLVPPWSSGAAK